MARYHLAKRFGNVPADSAGRNPMVVFGDYCGNHGLAKRFGNVAHGTDRVPFVVKPRGLCNSDGSLITGEYYLAKRFGNINGVPAVVPVCNRCGGSGSGSGSGGTCRHPTCCDWCCKQASDEPETTAPATLTGSVTSACGSYTQVMALTNCAFGSAVTGCETDGFPANLGNSKIGYSGSTTGSAVLGSCSPICGSVFSTWATEFYDLSMAGLIYQDYCSSPSSGSSSGANHSCLWKLQGSWRNATRKYTFCTIPTVVSCNPFYAYARLTIICDDFGLPGMCSWAKSECSVCVGNEILIEITQ